MEKWDDDGFVFYLSFNNNKSWRNEIMKIWCLMSLKQYISHGEMRWWFGVLHAFQQ